MKSTHWHPGETIHFIVNIFLPAVLKKDKLEGYHFIFFGIIIYKTLIFYLPDFNELPRLP